VYAVKSSSNNNLWLRKKLIEAVNTRPRGGSGGTTGSGSGSGSGSAGASRQSSLAAAAALPPLPPGAGAVPGEGVVATAAAALPAAPAGLAASPRGGGGDAPLRRRRKKSSAPTRASDGMQVREGWWGRGVAGALQQSSLWLCTVHSPAPPPVHLLCFISPADSAGACLPAVWLPAACSPTLSMPPSCSPCLPAMAAAGESRPAACQLACWIALGMSGWIAVGSVTAWGHQRLYP
jgi:hypothetical protein